MKRFWLWLDPIFGKWLRGKRGANDRVAATEKIVVVLRRKECK